MKTRIVYPRLWFDEKFAECSKDAKLLFMYLVTNNQVSLTRYSRSTDRQIMFDTGLSKDELSGAKSELEGIRWVFFYNDWIYHNHDAGYVDYTGRDLVMNSKKKETDAVPKDVVAHFKGLATR